MSKSSAWYARRYIERFGFHIVPIEPGRKFPRSADWGNSCLSTAEEAEQFYQSRPDWNMGVALGPSRVGSLDIDCWDSFETICECLGIDLQKLIRETPTIKARGFRIMFRLPAGVDLPYRKINWPSKNDPTGEKHKAAMRAAKAAKDAGDTEREQRIRNAAKRWAMYCVFELRSATSGDKQRQDVLPPSIHPDTGEPYRWHTQPREDWPEPPKWLLALWQNFDSFKAQMQTMCPWLPAHSAPEPKRGTKKKIEYTGDGTIDAYKRSTTIEAELERYGYRRISKNRYLSPHSSTGLPGVVVYPESDKCWIHHASDPLCSESSGHPVDAFDLFCYYEHNSDASKAVKAAAQALGIKSERKRTELAKAVTPAPEEMDPPPSGDAPEESRKRAEPYSPFKALGYNGNSYFYLPRGTEQVAEIRRGSHTSAADMLALAPIEWWEMAYPKDKGGVDWQLAASDLMRSCENVGIYSMERERGRGAWFDEGRAVLHLGTKLMVDGQITAISDHKSKYIYTKQAAMEMGVSVDQAPDSLGQQFTELFDQINWAKPIHSMYMAGFCALAPICGGLKWRPHIWLTARRGAGKSWMQDNMVAPLLGPCALMVQGNTSEAGIRQSIKQDARPVIFDEAESEDAGAQRRMQSVIELARQSSSDSTAQIVKGTVDGHGMAFRMRSMFMLGSINVSLSQAADESRFTVVTIAPHDRTPEEIERFGKFSAAVGNLFTEENCAAIRARIYRMLPTIRENASTFATAVAEELGDQRIGDQIGALLAGWYALIRRDQVTLSEARNLIRQLDFSDAEEAEQASDEESCLNRILQSQVRFDTSEGQKQRSIGELVDCAAGRGKIDGMYAVDANAVLGRYGLRVEGNYLDVANKHAELQKLLRDSPWAAGWRTILGRIEGAGPRPEPVRFAGVVSRVTRIPIR